MTITPAAEGGATNPPVMHRQVAENNGGDTRHLSRAEFNAQLAEVRAELFDVVSVAAATPVELGGVL